MSMQLLMVPQQKGEHSPEGSRDPAGGKLCRTPSLGPGEAQSSHCGCQESQEGDGPQSLGECLPRATLRALSAWGLLLGLDLLGTSCCLSFSQGSGLRLTFGSHFCFFGKFFLATPTYPVTGGCTGEAVFQKKEEKSPKCKLRRGGPRIASQTSGSLSSLAGPLLLQPWAE